MLEDLKDKLKDKFTLSDKKLAGVAKYAKWAQRYSKSSVIFWGVSAAAILGAHAFGFHLPAIITGFGLGGSVLMAAKSVAFAIIFKKVHKKATEATNNRLVAKGLPLPEPEPPVPTLSKIASIKKAFNPKTTIARIKSKLPKIHLPKPA